MAARVKSVMVAACWAFLSLFASAQAQDKADPLNSPVWSDVAKKMFGGEPFEFDDRVNVSVPRVVENQAQVPVMVDARGLANVDRLIVWADLNPIQHVLTFAPEPTVGEPYIAFRMKVEQATPVRAAARTSDGIWHLGGAFLDAAGGGCSSPALARDELDWADTVGNTQGRAWRQADGSVRLRFRTRHPMDTGLTKDNVPAFYIEKFDFSTPTGHLGTLETFEPVAEDPVISLQLRPKSGTPAIMIDGRDNNGTIYRARVPLPQSPAVPLEPPS